jgi:hypothetical protein
MWRVTQTWILSDSRRFSNLAFCVGRAVWKGQAVLARLLRQSKAERLSLQGRRERREYTGSVAEKRIWLGSRSGERRAACVPIGVALEK